MPSKVQGERGGFVVTRGKPRYAMLEGRHFVVGHGRSVERPTLESAYALRDEWLREDEARRTAARAAAAAPVPTTLSPGDRVRIDVGEGVVEEVGVRSVLVKTRAPNGGPGNLYRRAPGDCEDPARAAPAVEQWWAESNPATPAFARTARYSRACPTRRAGTRRGGR
jgi:hypothetical protein